MTRKVLIVCTGNSARSQMAEAIVNARLHDAWYAESAGTYPSGTVHPVALQVLAEVGIAHQGQSKPVAGFRDADIDLVVTVCETAAEQCPLWLGRGARVHLALPDPAGTAGSREEVLAAFRAVRDRIARDVPDLLERWSRTSSRNKEAAT